MVTPLLGPSLEDVFQLCDQGFSLKTTLMLFLQLLERLEWMHSHNFIHRDLKPDNIMLGIGAASHTIHLIDFGLTRTIVDPKTGKHIPFKTDKNLVGTCRFVSINAHKGYELSRRDDLISVGYIIINMFKGSLPWQYIDTRKPSARYRRLGRAKAQHTNERLCSDCPPQFLTYMNYVSSMAFE